MCGKKWRTCYFCEEFFNFINKFPVLSKASEKEKKEKYKHLEIHLNHARSCHKYKETDVTNAMNIW